MNLSQRLNVVLVFNLFVSWHFVAFETLRFDR